MNLGGHNILCDKGILIHTVLQIFQTHIVRNDSAAQVWLETSNNQENIIFDSAFYPGIVILHELTGIALVVRKLQENYKHLRSSLPIEMAAKTNHKLFAQHPNSVSMVGDL